MVANSLFKDVYGSNKIRNDMFTRTKAKDPNAKLFTNDYNVISTRYHTQVNHSGKSPDSFVTGEKGEGDYMITQGTNFCLNL